MKCIFEWQITDGFTYSCTETIPFECDDLEDFILRCIEDVQKSEFGCEILGCYVKKDEVDNLEYSFFTLEDWFKNNKILKNKQ